MFPNLFSYFPTYFSYFPTYFAYFPTHLTVFQPTLPDFRLALPDFRQDFHAIQLAILGSLWQPSAIVFKVAYTPCQHLVSSCELLNHVTKSYCIAQAHHSCHLSTSSITMDLRQHIQAAFQSLGDRVRTALQTQLGDAACLNAHRNECLHFCCPAGVFVLFAGWRQQFNRYIE